MAGFHEVWFPDNIAYGATGGPQFATTIVVTGAGHEQRNVNWAEARGRCDMGSGLKKQQQPDELIAFFRARKDRADRFPVQDWTDYKATGQLPGTGDGVQTQFQLVKRYPLGSVIEESAGSRSRWRALCGSTGTGIEQLPGWSVNVATGLITSTSTPGVNVQIRADFEFEVPVRLDTIGRRIMLLNARRVDHQEPRRGRAHLVRHQDGGEDRHATFGRVRRRRGSAMRRPSIRRRGLVGAPNTCLREGEISVRTFRDGGRQEATNHLWQPGRGGYR